VLAEKWADLFFHTGIASIPDQLGEWGRGLKTEARQLSWNLTYILMSFVALLLVVLFWVEPP